MRLWRISRHTALDGTGGMLESGRWHTAPFPVVYCADHPSTSLLEVLVHLEVDFEDLPNDFRLLEIDAPDHLIAPMTTVDILAPDWQSNEDYCRLHGDNWFNSLQKPSLSVPSAILPAAMIVVLNKNHPACSAVQLISVVPVKFDPRLWKSN